jgi:hypothetical protein
MRRLAKEVGRMARRFTSILTACTDTSQPDVAEIQLLFYNTEDLERGGSIGLRFNFEDPVQARAANLQGLVSIFSPCGPSKGAAQRAV